jgi:hypothetical protein
VGIAGNGVSRDLFPRPSTLSQVHTIQFTRTHFPFTRTQSVSKTGYFNACPL